MFNAANCNIKLLGWGNMKYEGVHCSTEQFGESMSICSNLWLQELVCMTGYGSDGML